MGKAYKNSDCTMIALMHCSSPLLTLIDRSCDVTYMTMHMLGHSNDVTNCSSVCKWVLAELFCVWKLEIQPVIDLCKSPVSEEASASYHKCILGAIVYPESYCALIGVSHQTGSLWTHLEYELVDANRVCPGIHKVRVGVWLPLGWVQENFLHITSWSDLYCYDHSFVGNLNSYTFHAKSKK